MKYRQMVLVILTALSASVAQAEDKKKSQTDEKKDSLVFTVVKENPITPVKNQFRSGTCWDFATVGFFEGEILRKTGRTYDLCEMFVANKNYVDEAIYYVRMHGDSRFSEGGSADDVLSVLQTHGICPEEAMPAPGSLVGDTLANFNEFFKVLTPYIEAVGKSKAKKLSPQWLVGYQGILDAYLGKCPERFVYEGKEYTPKSFAESLGLDFDDYVSYTSFTHHPFYTSFIIEAPYKWRLRPSHNVPLDSLMNIIDTALDRGYNVCWGGDVSGNGFDREGLALEEATPTQELRQQRFDSWEATYDHVMLIYGKAKDRQGRDYYMVKNSWGESGRYKGIWYMRKNYIALNTTYIFLNRHAIGETHINILSPQLPQAYTGKGVLVRETAIEGGTISTAGLPAGVYALQLGRLGSTLIRK